MWQTHIQWCKPQHDLIQKYGKDSYFAVTGCTDGIGKQLAFDFTKLGFQPILISRNVDKLENVSKQIQSKYNNRGLNPVTFQIDFSKATSSDFQNAWTAV